MTCLSFGELREHIKELHRELALIELEAKHKFEKAHAKHVKRASATVGQWPLSLASVRNSLLFWTEFSDGVVL